MLIHSNRLSISLSVLFSETPNSGGAKASPALPLSTALIKLFVILIMYAIADRFCGSILSCNHGDTANRGVLTSAKPFGFRVYFNNAGDDNSGDRGFALNYRQEMC